MRSRPYRVVALIAAFASLGAAAALADIPPPPYQGPDHATLGALNFRHERETGRSCGGGHCLGYHVDRVLLAGCEGKSANCDAVTKAGVIGWNVVSADGTAVDGELGRLIGAFGAARPATKLKVVLRQVAPSGSPARQVELQLDAK